MKKVSNITILILLATVVFIGVASAETTNSGRIEGLGELALAIIGSVFVIKFIGHLIKGILKIIIYLAIIMLAIFGIIHIIQG